MVFGVTINPLFSRLRPLALAGVLVFAGPLGATSGPVLGGANGNNVLPDIGTAAIDTLSLEKERQLGAAYMMFLRGSAPIADDPVLNDYIADLGYRLLRQADRLDQPFRFFLVNNPEINAFAFFGGYVGLHTGLFLYTDNESQLASVVAHEIAHVTQRHLARMMAEQERNTPLTIAGVLGSIALAVVAPGAGMAGMSAAMAAGQQASINFTRQHEQEADRIGMRMLTSAGFDPWGMPDFFAKMAAQFRFASKPPPMLLTHPLPDSRITDSRNRAADFQRQGARNEPLFQLARARVVVRFGTADVPALAKRLGEQLGRGERPYGEASAYAYALALTDAKRYADARKVLAPLLQSAPDNPFYLDTLADIAVASGDHAEAEKRLQAAAAARPNNAVITLNLANLWMAAGRYQQAADLLEQYRQQQPEDTLVPGMLETCYGKLGQDARMYQARAERLALVGNFPLAIEALQSAHRLYRDNEVEQMRIEARIGQFREQALWLKSL